MKKKISIIMILAFVLQAIFLFRHYNMWWDASVYLGMGHYIFSAGSIGIWELIRPLVWPLFLGLSWLIGFNDIIFGKILTMGFSLGSIYLTYLIAKKLGLKDDIPEISAALLAFVPVFFSFTFRLYTEIPSVFFALLACYFFLDKRLYLAGIFSAIAFLTKFPQGLIFAALVLLSVPRLKDIFKLSSSFLLTIMPYLFVNFLLYKNPVLPFIMGDEIVKEAGVWLFSGYWYYYAIELLKQSPLYILSILGFIVLFRHGKKLPAVLALLFFIYFSMHVHKEIRFAITFLPYIAILSSAGLNAVIKKKWLMPAAIVLGICILLFSIKPDYEQSRASTDYYAFLNSTATEDIQGKILTMQPIVNLYSPKAVEPMYFTVFNSELAQKWIDYISYGAYKISYVFIDTCEGGMLCPPDDANCEAKKAELILLLEKTYEKAYYAASNNCEYFVFKNN